MLATELLTPSGALRLLFSEPPQSGSRPAIFLDRDGVINERIVDGYVTRRSDFQFVPGIIEVLAELSKSDLPIIVISNQACVDRGLLRASELAEITRCFVDCLRRAVARIDAVYYCPHRPELGCACRKPREGLLRMAGSDWRLDLRHSVVVGDSLSDIEAAHAAGCHAILFDPARTEKSKSDAGPVTVQRVPDIGGAVWQCISAETVDRTSAIARVSNLEP